MREHLPRNHACHPKRAPLCSTLATLQLGSLGDSPYGLTGVGAVGQIRGPESEDCTLGSWAGVPSRGGSPHRVNIGSHMSGQVSHRRSRVGTREQGGERVFIRRVFSGGGSLRAPMTVDMEVGSVGSLASTLCRHDDQSAKHVQCSSLSRLLGTAALCTSCLLLYPPHQVPSLQEMGERPQRGCASTGHPGTPF